MHIALARAYRRLGQYSEALQSVEHAIELARGAEDQALVMVSELERGTTLVRRRRGESRAQALENVVIPSAVKYNAPWLEYQALSQEIRDHIYRGAFDQAQRAIARLLEIANALGDPQIHARVDLATGVVQYHRGAWTVAQRELLRAESALRRQGRKRPAIAANSWLTRTFVARGYWNEAMWSFERIRSLAADEGDPGLCWRATYAFAERALVEERLADALALLDPSLATLGSREVDASEALSLLAWGHVERGDIESAESLIAQSIGRLASAGATCSLLEAQCIQARVQMRQGRLQPAHATLKEALTLSRELPYPYVEAKALYLDGQAHALEGESQQARNAFSEALTICDQLGEKLYSTVIQRALTQSQVAEKEESGLVHS
jgi:tetratricopeptide (TPR) repeat protein